MIEPPFPVTCDVRQQLGLRGPVMLADIKVARRLAPIVSRTVPAPTQPHRPTRRATRTTRRSAPTTNGIAAPSVGQSPAPVEAGDLFAAGVLHKVLSRVLGLYVERVDRAALTDALAALDRSLGRKAADTVLARYATEFPDDAAGREDRLAGLLSVWLANVNPALGPMRGLFDDHALAASTAYEHLVAATSGHFTTRPPFGPDDQPLVAMLRSPALAVPESIAGQLAYIRERWAALLGDLLDLLALGLDVLDEEARGRWARFHPGGGGGTPGARALGAALGGMEGEPEHFSVDSEWMPRLVLIAKSAYVWLDQLSKRTKHEVHRLDQIPDAELDRLASWGVTGLWLIGVWQRSRASERIKQLRGNPEAVASAYSLDDYRIADDLGGEDAYANLRDRAWARGIRLTSDMVPNHMGIDSSWVVEHPERFLSLPEPPYPSYTFTGTDLSEDPRVEIRIEDHYWDGTDAAVVFQRRDTATGETRYVYHGNDGTSFPWNDTAQLNYLDPQTREAVIQTILDVARRFPVIRFDAAMTLARRHIRRLWFPEPGAGGSIPSRAEHAMPQADFDATMPHEFWREVVDRVAAEVPDTLLLAEAFWLMEGYFVRTLGMHRVYNSAFMHMLRDEDNAGYRRVMRDTLEFDPEILKRYVNFMSNPDEKTAVEQFGRGDKYFGVATVLATLPGLPMLGHGQVEGFTEKYGMEYRRAYLDERPDEGLVAYHERQIFPLLHRRAQFAEVRDFLLYDVVGDNGSVVEDVFAYSNVGPAGERSLVVYHNAFGSTAGRLRVSGAYSVPDPAATGGRRLTHRSLSDGWRLPLGETSIVTWREAVTGLEHIRRADALRKSGLRVELGPYQRLVLLDVRDVVDGSAGLWRRLADRLGDRGVPSLEASLQELALEPVHGPVGVLIGSTIAGLIASGRAPQKRDLESALGAVARAIGEVTAADAPAQTYRDAVITRLATIARQAASPGTHGHDRTDGAKARPRSGKAAPDALQAVSSAFGDPWHRAVLAGWAAVEPLGRLARGSMIGPTSRAWFDELRLEPIVTGALVHAGLDQAGAAAATERIRTLLALPRPSNVGGRSVPDRARRVVDAWLAHPDVRAFIRVNRWEGVEWFGRDEWRELLDWALLLDTIDAADAAAEPDAARSSSVVVQRLLETGEAVAYRVDRLRTVAAPTPKPPATKGTSRTSSTAKRGRRA